MQTDIMHTHAHTHTVHIGQHICIPNLQFNANTHMHMHLDCNIQCPCSGSAPSKAAISCWSCMICLVSSLVVHYAAAHQAFGAHIVVDYA